MRKTFPIHPIVLLSTLIGAIFGCVNRDAPMSKDAREIYQADKTFDSVVVRTGADGWVSFFAENGSMVSQDEAPITGKPAIRQAMEIAFSDTTFTLRWSPTNAEILIPDYLGYTVGTWERRWKKANGKRVLLRGKYSTLWMKQKDGSWKIVFDTGSSDGAPVGTD